MRNTDNLFKLWSCSLVLFYNSKVFREGREKEKQTGGLRRKRFSFWFRSFVWLGENQNLKLNSVWNRKFPAWNRPISTILADSVCGIIWERSSQKSRAQKMSGGAAGGLPAMLRKAIAGGGRRAERPACRQAGNSDEARTAKPDERGADARHN